MQNPAAVSLTDLTAAGIRLRPTDAATIARQVVQLVDAGSIRGIPSPHVIRLTADGRVEVEGPVAAGGQVVRHAGALLAALLSGPGDRPLSTATPLGRLATLAQAEPSPWSTLAGFESALARYASQDAAALLRSVHAAWTAAATPRSKVTDAPSPADSAQAGALTISDVRRARRATGLSLAEISRRSRIPADLLRQLEWGYLRNWPTGRYGRVQAIRYARAAGLDEAAVHQALALAAAAPAAGAAPSGPVRDRSRVVIVDAGVSGDELLFGEEEVSAAGRAGDRAVASDAIAVPPVPPERHRPAPLAPAAAVVVALGLSAAAGFFAVRSVEHFRRAGPAADSTDVRGARADRPLAAPATDETPRAVVPAEVAFAPPVAARRRPRPAIAPVGPLAAPRPVEWAPDALPLVPTPVAAALAAPPVTAVAASPRLVQVSDAGRMVDATMTRDGARLAFESGRGGASGIYVADVNGPDGKAVRLVSGTLPATDPAWSTDGRILAFTRVEPDAPGLWNVWTVPASGGQPRQVTTQRTGRIRAPAWFPDGRRLVYALGSGLVVLDTATGERQAYPVRAAAGALEDLAVSPDGRRVMFGIGGDGGWLLDLPAGAMRKVISDTDARRFTWSDDGRRVAYAAGSGGEWRVWVMAGR